MRPSSSENEDFATSRTTAEPGVREMSVMRNRDEGRAEGECRAKGIKITRKTEGG